MFIRLLGIIALFLVFTLEAGELDDSIHARINANYHRLTQAYQALDAERMAAVYTKDGFYIPPGKNREIIQGREQILGLYRAYFAKVKKHHAKLQIRFRLRERLLDNNTVSDIGYYLVTITPPAESKQPVKLHAGKFLITARQQNNGQWAFWADANSDVDLEKFTQAKPIQGLLYDSFHPVTHPISSEIAPSS